MALASVNVLRAFGEGKDDVCERLAPERDGRDVSLELLDGLQPIRLCFKQGGFFRQGAGARFRHAPEGKFLRAASRLGKEDKRRFGHRSVALQVTIEHVRLHLAGGTVEDEFEMELVVGDVDRRSAVRRSVIIFTGVVGMGLFPVVGVAVGIVRVAAADRETKRNTTKNKS